MITAVRPNADDGRTGHTGGVTVASAGAFILAVQASRLRFPCGLRGSRAAIERRQVKPFDFGDGLRRGDVRADRSMASRTPSREPEARTTTGRQRIRLS